jgi:tetratricopeptide (TPR) repeat protein
MTRKNFLSLFLSAVALGSSVFAQAQKSTDIDVQHYKIDAELIPAAQLLRSRAEVTFVPQAETRSVVFEMNGSLTISRITLKSGTALAATAPAATAGAVKQLTSAPPQRAGQPRPKPGATQPQPESAAAGLQFIQDNRENMNVRIDLGAVMPARQSVTLVFEYEGALESAQGGPIQNARLAYVGEQGSYLTYAARWFPFHEYAGDRSTYQIALTVPKGVVVAGYSETPVAAVATTPGEVKDPETGKASKVERTVFSFTSTKPVLPGNFAAAKYIVKPFNFAGLTVEVFSKAGDEQYAERVAEIVGKRLEYYSSKFGPYAFGNRIAVAETDEETLESYVGAGTIFMTPPAFATGNEDKLARDVAYQWWGQAVGIKSFDDIWLSQGLAQFSALLYYKDNGSETQFQQAIQAEMEKALAFEQAASIRNAPKQLDDQTPAYRSVVFNKGALVFNMLRQLMGEQKFDAMLRDYYVKFGGKNPTLEEFEAYVSKAAGRNLRSFFGQWVDSTGVPEFRAEYRMLRTKDGFRVPGTVKQELEAFEMPVEILLRTEAGMERETVLMKGTSVDFDILTKSKPVEVIIDPDAKIMRSSDELRQAVVVRRGIEHFREQEYTEAEQQFNAAIKLNRGNSWAWYNLGILYMTQRNYQKALDAFDQAVNGSLKPDWIEVWSYIYRGNAWDAIDQRERALADYKKAVDNGNNYDNAQAVAQKYIEQKFDPKAQKPAV